MLRLAVIVVVFVAAPLAAHAQGANVIDQIVGQFKTVTAGWEGTLQRLAMSTFGILALIQFAWGMIRQALRRADFSEFTAEIVNQIMFIGLFYWLLTTTTAWGPAIINGFREAAGQASGTQVLTPGDVFNAGLNIAQKIMAQISVWHPGAVAGLIIAGIVVMACFAVIVAIMVIALVRTFFIASAGVLFMAFGGSMWTSEIAVSVVRKTMSVGAGLFTLQLIASIGMTFIQQWVSQFNDVTSAGLLIEIGSAIVLLAVCWVIPDDIASLIGAGAFSHGGALMGAAAGTVGVAAMVGAGAGRMATGIAGAGSAVGGAARLANTQVASRISRGTGPTSTVGRIATLTGKTAGNISSAVGRDIGRRLSGQSMGRGTLGFRVSEDLRQTEEQVRKSSPGLSQYQNRGP